MAWDTIDWAKSSDVGGATEVAVLTPIINGRIPNERRTYEERLAEVIAGIDDRAKMGLPIELSRIPSIHFGRLIILRPEQFLQGARLLAEGPGGEDVDLLKKDDEGAPAPLDPYIEDPDLADSITAQIAHAQHIPNEAQRQAVIGQLMALKGFAERRGARNDPSRVDCPSMLLTIVSFDGDLKVYMRDIAETLGADFDRIFENTVGYPASGAGEFGQFWPWLRRHQIPVQLFMPVYPDVSVAKIKHLELFKRRFDALVAEIEDMDREHLRAVRRKFDDFVAENSQISSGFPSNGGLYDGF
ncbi:MAG: hypothetical protein AAF666_01345 [Pseudomonadota bacterium]